MGEGYHAAVPRRCAGACNPTATRRFPSRFPDGNLLEWLQPRRGGRVPRRDNMLDELIQRSEAAIERIERLRGYL